MKFDTMRVSSMGDDLADETDQQGEIIQVQSNTDQSSVHVTVSLSTISERHSHTFWK